MASESECPAIRVGCAGWSLPRELQGRFPPDGTHLERYAARFPAVEINSTFYRSHRPATYERWRAAVPESFRFSVKLPRRITHELRLRDAEEPLDRLLAEVSGLGEALGCVLVQLPPSLAFDEASAEAFFRLMREQAAVPVVCEPRHPSWFSEAAAHTLAGLGVGRAAADPAVVPEAAAPGAGGPAYYRLHGSPRTYYSAYPDDYLDRLAAELARTAAAGREAWCIFDNTASGAATANALDLLGRLAG